MKLWLARRAGKCSIGETSVGTRLTLSRRPAEKRPVAIECKWSANNFDPTNLVAFRYQHPEGDNLVLAHDVERAFTRSYGDLRVRLMAFGPSPIRFLRRPSEAPLLSAGREKAVECRSELGASFPLIFRPSGGVGDDTEAPPT
jgi:hypothetical protein